MADFLQNFSRIFSAPRDAAVAVVTRARAWWRRRAQRARAFRPVPTVARALAGRRGPGKSWTFPDGDGYRFNLPFVGVDRATGPERTVIAEVRPAPAGVRLAFSQAEDGPRCLRCASVLWTDHARGDVLRCLLCEPMGAALETVRSRMDAAELRRLRFELALWDARL